MKQCNQCNEIKELAEFSKAKKHPDGLRYNCRSCAKIARKAYYIKNKSIEDKRNQEWRRLHRDKVSEYNKEYNKANKESINKYNRRYARNRRVKYPTVRLIHRMRVRVGKAVEGIGKDASTMELLGCTAEQFREHIESQFVNGMGWNQRGKWAVDHIIPIAAFDMSKPKHQRYAFHYSNCQPLWAEDNRRKSDKYCPKELKAYLASTLMEYSLKGKDENN